MKAAIVMLPALILTPLAEISAQRVSSGEVPQEILDGCDAAASAFGDYEAPIDSAKDALLALGVFTEADFRSVKIGFCDLQGINGPVATTSCERDTILLDHKYKDKNQGLVLGATLAHEMKHYFQHTAQKAKYGDHYCFSDQYADDQAWMEEEADRFGDEVAELLFVGRPIEIRNDCPAAVSIYLETDIAFSGSYDERTFVRAPSNSTVSTEVRSGSKNIIFYAHSDYIDDRQRVWRGATREYRRVIGGEFYDLKPIVLSSAPGTKGPFRLTLSCP